MELGHSGRVLRLDPKTAEVRQLAGGLGYAFGACASGGEVLVSESWRHRLVSVAPNGASNIVLDHLPVYPSRLAPAGRRRLLADGVHRPHPARRVRAARARLSPPHDEGDRPRAIGWCRG